MTAGIIEDEWLATVPILTARAQARLAGGARSDRDRGVGGPLGSGTGSLRGDVPVDRGDLRAPRRRA